MSNSVTLQKRGIWCESEKGHTTDLEVKNAFDAKIYKAAMDALKRMPKWKPGTDDKGDPTPVKITIPVDFK
jgi:periplasmic protein TonB